MRYPGPAGKPVDILLVEDNPADAELTRLGLEEGQLAVRLSVVMNGDDVLPFLRRQGPYAGARRPGLILLDLNLTGKDGREALHEIKHAEDLKDIPVIVLTTSDADQDIFQAYKLYANAYMKKPVDFDQFVKLVRGASEYWFSLVKLPR
jgi:two-component system response regulator